MFANENPSGQAFPASEEMSTLVLKGREIYFMHQSSPCRLQSGGSEDKASVCNAVDLGLIPGLGRSSGEGNCNPVQYSCLENPVDGGAWWAIVHGVAKSRSDTTEQAT